jgi:hypothetical protein
VYGAESVTTPNSEKVSSTNLFAVEIWKSKYKPLDVECAGMICDQSVPDILQGNARKPACIFAQISFLILISKI